MTHDARPASAPTPSSTPSSTESPLLASLADKRGEFLAFLERRVGSRELAEDILQDALVKSIDKLSTVRNDESVVAWFYRSLRNAVVDHHRRRQSSQKALDALASESEAVAEPEAEAGAAVCPCVSRLARQLKPEYAEALQQVEVGEQPVHQFAEQRGISSNNAAVRVHRAREALRKQVTATCGECAAAGCMSCTCAQPAPAAEAEPAVEAVAGPARSAGCGSKKGCGQHGV